MNGGRQAPVAEPDPEGRRSIGPGVGRGRRRCSPSPCRPWRRAVATAQARARRPPRPRRASGRRHPRPRPAAQPSPPSTSTPLAPFSPTWWRWLPHPSPVAPVPAWCGTGREMIVWGGRSDGDKAPLADGAAYDPKSDTWRTIAAAPSGRAGDARRSAVGTGEEAGVLGGELPDGPAGAPPTTRAMADVEDPPRRSARRPRVGVTPRCGPGRRSSSLVGRVRWRPARLPCRCRPRSPVRLWAVSRAVADAASGFAPTGTAGTATRSWPSARSPSAPSSARCAARAG